MEAPLRCPNSAEKSNLQKNQTNETGESHDPNDGSGNVDGGKLAGGQCFVVNNYSTAFRGNDCPNVEDDLRKTSSFSHKNNNTEAEESCVSKASDNHNSSVPTLHLLPDSLKKHHNILRKLSLDSTSPSENASETTEKTTHTELSVSLNSEAPSSHSTFIPVYQKPIVSVDTAPLAAPSPQPIKEGVSSSPISPRQSSRRALTKKATKSPKSTRLPIRSPPNSPRSPIAPAGESASGIFGCESPIVEEESTDSDSERITRPSRKNKQPSVIWSNHNYNKEFV